MYPCIPEGSQSHCPAADVIPWPEIEQGLGFGPFPVLRCCKLVPGPT